MVFAHSAGRMALVDLKLVTAHLAGRMALVDLKLVTAHSAGRMTQVNMELAFVQSAVKTAVVKVAFGHLAGTMASGHLAAKMTEVKVAFASWIYNSVFAVAGSPLLTHLQLLCTAQSLPSPSLGLFVLEASHPCTFRLVP